MLLISTHVFLDKSENYQFCLVEKSALSGGLLVPDFMTAYAVEGTDNKFVAY